MMKFDGPNVSLDEPIHPSVVDRCVAARHAVLDATGMEPVGAQVLAGDRALLIWDADHFYLSAEIYPSGTVTWFFFDREVYWSTLRESGGPGEIPDEVMAKVNGFLMDERIRCAK